MEIEYDRRDDHAVDISSDHESAAAPSQANNSVADQHTSLMAACDSTDTTAATSTIHQTSSSQSIKHGPSQDQQADDNRKHVQNCNETVSKKATEVCLNIASVFLFLLVIIITGSLALVFTCTLIPGIIICLVLAYMITSLHQFSRCDDYADLDDEYDTELGSYRYDLVLWMIQLTGILLGELLLCLVLFRIGPFALRRLSLLDVRVWKWFLIGIIVLVYLGIWSLTHIVIHKAREKSLQIREGVFFRVHIVPILKGLLGAAVCGFYFLVEFLIMKLVPPLRRPKILGLSAHKWMHVLVYVFIGLNVSRIISASIVAVLQKKHEHKGNIDYKTGEAVRPPCYQSEGRCKHPSEIPDFMSKGCTFIMRLLFGDFDLKKCTIYEVIGLRRSINFVLISIWLLVTWISHFEYQLKTSHDTTWILTGTLICLLICAILWLVKNSIMLWWKYHSIYNRFNEEVSKEGIQLYLLGMICGPHLDVLKVGWRSDQKNNNNSSSTVDDEKKENAEESRKGRIVAKARRILAPPEEKKNAEDSRRIDRVIAKARSTLVPIKADRQKGDHQSMNTTADDKTSHQPGIYAIMRMVKYFLRAEDTFKKDINASFEKLRKKWLQAHYDQNGYSTPLTLGLIEAAYGTKLSCEDFKNLLSQIKGDQNSEREVNLQDFERWMERSHKTCYNRASTLASAQRLAQYLNRVMIAVIILATIAIWLTVVTKSTKAVSIFGGLLAALAFILKDTFSTVFKGIIFSYVIHRYGIGDICIINDTWYEVKRISIWKTTFLKVKTKQVVSYPNSALLDDPIIKKTNKKGRLDGHDYIEFILESNINKKKILELKKRIDDYFLKKQSDFLKPQFEMKYGMGDTGEQNVTIHFKHKLKYSRGMSNLEFLKEMEKRKENLQSDITELCPGLKKTS